MSRVLISLAALACLIIQGCGGDSSNPNATDSQIQAFLLNATVSEIYGTPGFKVSVDDLITGSFSYNTDESLYVNKGTYPQDDPAIFTFSINDFIFSSDPMDNTTYKIQVENNSTYVNDLIIFTAYDPVLAAQYGVDEVQVRLVLGDVSQQVFSDNSLPIDLNINDFSDGYMQIDAINWEEVSPGTRIGTTIWEIYVQFETIQVSKN